MTHGFLDPFAFPELRGCNARKGVLPFRTVLTYVNNAKKIKIGIGVDKFPVINSRLQKGQGRREDRGEGVSVPVTKLIRINYRLVSVSVNYRLINSENAIRDENIA